jgi:hypothetical protein
MTLASKAKDLYPLKGTTGFALTGLPQTMAFPRAHALGMIAPDIEALQGRSVTSLSTFVDFAIPFFAWKARCFNHPQWRTLTANP